MIKIFTVEPMTYTPFSGKKAYDFFWKRGILITEDENDCDVVVSRLFRNLQKFVTRYPNKKYLIWTHEPRDNTYLNYFGDRIKGILGLPTIHIMNAYTGDIYINNHAIYAPLSEPLDYVSSKPFTKSKQKKIAVLTQYRNNKRKWSLKKGGKELDLCYLRTKIALVGYKLNKIDIYGKGWPDGISLEDSRCRGWQDRKKEILKNYNFNLCFENTNIDYYCSEKIWDSINTGCLPIYYGKGNKIYEDFPRDSFVDYSNFQNPEDLFKYIEDMSEEEFRYRMNLCIGVYNEGVEKRQHPRIGRFMEGVLLNIVQKLQEIVYSAD